MRGSRRSAAVLFAVGFALVLLGTAVVSFVASRQGGGSPSLGMVQAVEANYPAAFGVGIDLGTQRMVPGRVSIRLDRSSGETGDATQAHSSLTANASYVHLGRWRVSSDEATCEW
jgi:hypothetical protein